MWAMLWFFHVKWALNPNKDMAHSNLASKFSYREPNVLFLIPSKIQKMHQKKENYICVVVEHPSGESIWGRFLFCPIIWVVFDILFRESKMLFLVPSKLHQREKIIFDILCFVDHPSGESIRGRFPFRLIVRLAGDKWPEHGKEPKFLWFHTFHPNDGGMKSNIL